VLFCFLLLQIQLIKLFRVHMAKRKSLHSSLLVKGGAPFTGIFLLEQIARASSFLLRRMYTLMLLPFVARAILAFASILLFCNCIPLVIRYFSNGKKYANSEFACRTAFSRKQPVILFQFYTHNFHVQNREMDPEVGQIGRRWMIFALDASLFFSCSFPPPNEMALLSGEPHIWWI